MSEIIKENVTEEFNADTYLENLEAELFNDEKNINESTLEEKKEAPSKEFIIDCLEFAMNFDDDYVDEVFTEGFNNDLKKQYNQDIKEIKKIMKNIKGNLKENRHSIDSMEIAIVNLEKLEEKIDKMVKDIQDTKGDKAATLVGHFYRAFIGTMKMFAAFIVTLPIGGAGSIVAMVEQAITDSFGIYSRIIEKIKSGEELSIDDFNSYKNSLISKYKAFKEKIAKMKKELQDQIDFEKKAKEEIAKEKVNDIFEQEKLKLYEACSAGEITEDQREDLINRFRLTSKVEESVLVNDVNEDYSNKDAFDIVKKDIYERCAKGEFDIDAREDLIKEAYARFMEGEDSVDKIVDSFKKKNNLEQDSKKLISDVNNSVTV